MRALLTLALAGAGLRRRAGGTLPKTLALVQVKLVLALHAEVSAEAALAAGRPALCREGRRVSGTARGTRHPPQPPKTCGVRAAALGKGKGNGTPPTRPPPDPAPPGMLWEMKASPFPQHWDPQGGEGSRGTPAGAGPTCASVDLQAPHAKVARGTSVDAHPVLADAVPPDEQEEPVVAGDAAVVLRAQDAARAVFQQAGTRCGDKRRRGALAPVPRWVPAPCTPSLIHQGDSTVLSSLQMPPHLSLLLKSPPLSTLAAKGHMEPSPPVYSSLMASITPRSRLRVCPTPSTAHG